MMTRLGILLLCFAIFSTQVVIGRQTSTDQNKVKRLLILYTPVDGLNLDWNADGSLMTVTDQTTDSDNFIWWRLENDLWVRSDVVEESGKCF